MAEKAASRTHVWIATGVALLGLLIGSLGLYFDYERRQEARPSVRLAFASTWGMPVANNKFCTAIGFDALNESSNPVTLAKPRLMLLRESPKPVEDGGEDLGWVFDLIRDTSDDPLGERLPPPVADPGGAAYHPANFSDSQLTRLDPGEVVRYRLPLTNHIVSKMRLPEFRDKPITFEISDFAGHTWRHRFTPGVRALSGSTRSPRMPRHCALVLIYEKRSGKDSPPEF